MSGYATDQELLWYQNEGVRYDVDLVILEFCGNDERQNHQRLVYRVYPKPWFTIEDGELVLEGSPVPHVDWFRKYFLWLREHSGLASFIARRINSRFELDEVKSSDDTSYDLTVALLRKLRKVVEAHDARLLIVSAYEWQENGKSSRELSDLLRADGFLVIDVERTPGFDPDTMIIERESHWNATGHAFVAKAIEDAIEENNLLGNGNPDPGR